MSTLQTSSVSAYYAAISRGTTKNAQEASGASQFDALLANFTTVSKPKNNNNSNSALDVLSLSGSPASSGSPLDEFISQVGDSTFDSVSSMFDAIVGKSSAPTGGFGFSTDFMSTFGTSGPLFDYINMITKSLGLDAEQNKALQNIAIKHKDTDASAADIQQIAVELKEAGIG